MRDCSVVIVPAVSAAAVAVSDVFATDGVAVVAPALAVGVGGAVMPSLMLMLLLLLVQSLTAGKKSPGTGPGSW